MLAHMMANSKGGQTCGAHDDVDVLCGAVGEAHSAPLDVFDPGPRLHLTRLDQLQDVARPGADGGVHLLSRCPTFSPTFCLAAFVFDGAPGTLDKSVRRLRPLHSLESDVWSPSRLVHMPTAKE